MTNNEQIEWLGSIDQVIRDNLIWYKENGSDHGDLVIAEEAIKTNIKSLLTQLQEKNIKAVEGKLEEWASREHERWSRWQTHLHSKCAKHTINSLNATTKVYEDIETGNLIIPRELVQRWERQIDTPYAQLSESEKESDRKEVRPYIDDVLALLKSI